MNITNATSNEVLEAQKKCLEGRAWICFFAFLFFAAFAYALFIGDGSQLSHLNLNDFTLAGILTAIAIPLGALSAVWFNMASKVPFKK